MACSRGVLGRFVRRSHRDRPAIVLPRHSSFSLRAYKKNAHAPTPCLRARKPATFFMLARGAVAHLDLIPPRHRDIQKTFRFSARRKGAQKRGIPALTNRKLHASTFEAKCEMNTKYNNPPPRHPTSSTRPRAWRDGYAPPAPPIIMDVDAPLSPEIITVKRLVST